MASSKFFALNSMSPANEGGLLYRLYWQRVRGKLRSRRFNTEAAARRKTLEHEARIYFSAPARARVLARRDASKSTGTGLLDYLLLHRYIVGKRPRKILECGSGVSTLVIAQALEEVEMAGGGAGHLQTMEDQEKYFDDAQKICPEDLRRFVTYNHAPLVHGKVCGVMCDHYAERPAGPYDFIFVDGPNVPRPREPIDGDALLEIERQPDHQSDIVIDGRYPTLYAFARVLRPSRIRRDPALNVGIVKGANARMLSGAPHAWKYPREVNVLRYMEI